MPEREIPSDNAGFTLIELSIVLVIIGLLVGGILVGRDLIKSAEMRGAVSQIEKFKSAARAFELKFNCIPGDCADAVALGLGTSGGAGDNGNGDGVVHANEIAGQGMFGSYWPEQQESLNFWYHLSQANLINFSALGYNPVQPAAMDGYIPVLKLSGKVYVYAFTILGGSISSGLSFGNSFYLASGLSTTSSPPCGGYQMCRELTALESFYIDSKIDDGRPFSGKVQAGYNYGGPAIAGNFVMGCSLFVDGTPAGDNQYDLQGVLQYNDFALVTQVPPDPNAIKCILAIGDAF